MESHWSRPISAALVAKTDMIVVMEVWQLDALRRSNLGIHDRLFLLSPMGAATAPRPTGYSAMNIEDPYGGELGRFVACFDRIERCIHGLIQEIRCRER
jgi:protein-tyrosine-phosphatase